VRRGRPIVFPRDHGAHLSQRIEWWYVTGWIGAKPDAPTHGVQVTFFRLRTGLAQDLGGRFAPRHLLMAHAAITDLGAARHVHAQRLARWSGDAADDSLRARASLDDARVRIGAWRLARRDGEGGLSVWSARIDADGAARGWSIDLEMHASQPPLLQGDAGFSLKGPTDALASHYVTEPQLDTRARVRIEGRDIEGRGRAWLDHEWSDLLIPEEAVGWDWIGMNLDDGGALMAFRVRRADGSALWAGGSRRDAAGAVRVFGAQDVRFEPRRTWRSPATGGDYPVQWLVTSPAGRFEVRSLLDAQELDARASTGTVYWEGLSSLHDAQGRRVGWGYLEMTGYVGRVRL
jgi:predicted secreted hydrolase